MVEIYQHIVYGVKLSIRSDDKEEVRALDEHDKLNVRQVSQQFQDSR